MTFIVAETGPRGVRIHADWLVSRPDGDADFRHAPVLKAVVLNGYQCVCWAGDVDRALDVIRALFVRGTTDAGDDDAVLEVLLQAHVASRGSNGVQFLLASLLGRRPVVHEITGGGVHRNLRFGWLGNQDALQRYRHLRGVTLPADERASWIAMDRAFAQILFDAQFVDVGGHYSIIVRTTEEGELGYAFSARAYPSPPASSSNHEYEPLRIGDTASGGFSPSVLVPWRAGRPTIGVWFPEGPRGYVLDPSFRPRGAHEIEAPDLDAFLGEIHRRTGCRLRGAVILDGQARFVAM